MRLAKGDAPTAWALATVNRHAIQADYDLVSESGLAAQLAVPGARPPASWQVIGQRRQQS